MSSKYALALCFLSSTAVLAAPAARQQNPTKYFVSFGDSYTQSGFNVNGAMPNPSNPFGNPFPGEGTASGGKMWLHYLAMNYNSTLTYAYNFAYGGATTDETLVPAYSTSVKSVRQQLYEQFLPNLSKEPFDPANTIFSLFIGINECKILDLIQVRGANADRYLPKLMAKRAEFTDTMYKAGARHFLFQNIPPIDRTPQVINGGKYWVQFNKDWVTAYNKALAQFNKDFKKKYPDVWLDHIAWDEMGMFADICSSTIQVVVYQYDLWRYFTKVLDNPTRYGFTSAQSQSQSGDYPNLWFGDYHPGFAFDNLWAKDLSKTFKF